MKIYKFSFKNELDVLAKNIAKYIFSQIIANKRYGQIVLKSMPEQNIDLSICGIKKIVFDVVGSDGVNISVVGEYFPSLRFPYIKIGVNFSKFNEKYYEFLLQQLKYTIRHEIEHAAYQNGKEMPVQPLYEIPKERPSVLEGINLAKRYLLDPSEIDAYIRDAMMEAKNKKIPIEKLIVNLIEDRLYEVDPKNIKNQIKDGTELGKYALVVFNEIKKEYIKRIKNIYNRRGQTNDK